MDRYAAGRCSSMVAPCSLHALAACLLVCLLVCLCACLLSEVFMGGGVSSLQWACLFLDGRASAAVQLNGWSYTGLPRVTESSSTQLGLTLNNVY